MENFNHHAKTLLSAVERARREDKPTVLTEDHCVAITDNLRNTSTEPMAMSLVPYNGNDKKTVRLLNPMKLTHIVDQEKDAAAALRQFWIMCAGTTQSRITMSTGVLLHPNIEGVALTVRYDSSGLFALAYTRGDGVIGVDVTAHILAGITAGTVRIPLMVPSEFADEGSLEIRGILYCRTDDFVGLFSSSSRAVNSILQSPPEDPKALPLYFCATEVKSFVVAYCIVQICSSRTKLMEYLKSIGFEVPEYAYLSVSREDIFRDLFFDADDVLSDLTNCNLEKQIKYGVQNLETEIAKRKLPYAVDGILVAADVMGNHVAAYLSGKWSMGAMVAPHTYDATKIWANFQTHDLHKVLLKRKTSAVTTIVEDVVWEHVNFNNHFTLSAVAKIHPVSVEGKTVDYAVLGSISRLESLTEQSDVFGSVRYPDVLHLGMNPAYPVSKGATVGVELSLDYGLVPVVRSVVKAGEEALTVPVMCPYCNAEVDTSKLQDDSKEDYALKIVHEQNCVVRESQTISLVLNRLRRLNISPYVVHTLFNLGHLPNGLASMFSLTVDKLTSVPGVEQETAQTLVNCLDTKNNPIPWDCLVRTLFMTADWINSVEHTEASFPMSLSHFKTFKAFETAHKNLDQEKLANITDTLPSFLHPNVTIIDAKQVLSAIEKHTNYAIDVVNKMLKEKVNVTTKTQSDLAKGRDRVKDTPLAGKKVRLHNLDHQSYIADMWRVVSKLGGHVVTKGDADIHLFHRYKCRTWHRLAPEKEKYLLCDFLDKFSL